MLFQVPGVISVHALHVWQLSGNCVIATVHIVIRDDCNFTQVAQELKKIFHEVDVHSTTIQPEFRTSSIESSSVERCNCDEMHECPSPSDSK